MNWKPRGIILLFLAFTAFAAVAVWRVSDGWVENFEEQELLSLEREASASARQTQAYNEMFSDQLLELAGREMALRQTDPEARLPRSEFLQSEFAAVAIIKANRDQNFKVDWVLVQSALQNKWPMEKIKTMLLEMPLAQARARDAIWFRLPEASQTLFALMINVSLPSGENAVAVGWLPTTSLSRWSDAFKSTEREFFVVDERGYALAFDEQQYVGALLEKDPMVAETMKRRSLSWSGKSKDLSGKKVWVAVEKVHASNLYVGVARAQTWAGHFPFGRTVELILWGLALAALVWWRLEETKKSSVVVLETTPAVEEPQSTVAPAPAIVQPNTDELFKIFSGRIAKSFSGPISNILGHLQMARAKLPNSNVEEHFANIEREARRVRETLDSLELLSEPTDTHEKKKVDVQEIVLLALDDVKADLHVKNIRVVRDLKPTADIMARADSLKFALTEVLKVSSESMLGCADRKITVTSVQVGETVKITIEDTGDTHFRSGATDQIGLGLTAVRGVVQSLGGSVRVDAQAGRQGNIVTLEFPAIAKPAPVVQPVEVKAINEDEDEMDDFIFKSPKSSAVVVPPQIVSPSNSNSSASSTSRSSSEAPVVFGMELSEESPVQASHQQTFVVNIRKPKARTLD